MIRSSSGQPEVPTACEASCVDLTSDDDNCGACAHGCGPGSACGNGVCSPVPTIAVPKPATCGQAPLPSGRRRHQVPHGGKVMKMSAGAPARLSAETTASSTRLGGTEPSGYWTGRLILRERLRLGRRLVGTSTASRPGLDERGRSTSARAVERGKPVQAGRCEPRVRTSTTTVATRRRLLSRRDFLASRSDARRPGGRRRVIAADAPWPSGNWTQVLGYRDLSIRAAGRQLQPRRRATSISWRALPTEVGPRVEGPRARPRSRSSLSWRHQDHRAFDEFVSFVGNDLEFVWWPRPAARCHRRSCSTTRPAIGLMASGVACPPSGSRVRASRRSCSRSTLQDLPAEGAFRRVERLRCIQTTRDLRTRSRPRRAELEALNDAVIRRLTVHGLDETVWRQKNGSPSARSRAACASCTAVEESARRSCPTAAAEGRRLGERRRARARAPVVGKVAPTPPSRLDGSLPDGACAKNQRQLRTARSRRRARPVRLSAGGPDGVRSELRRFLRRG